MRKSSLACVSLAAVLSLVSLAAAATEVQKPEPGFAGLIWGAAPTKEMILDDGRPDGQAIYRKGRETDEVGGVPADAIRYVFWKNRLMMVVVHGKKGFSSLLSSLADSWGPGFQADPTQQRFTWTSTGPSGRTIAGLDMDKVTGYYLSIFSEEMTDGMEVEQAMAEKSK